MNHFSRLLAVVSIGLLAPVAHGYNYLTASCGAINFNSGQMTFNYASNLSSAEKLDISRAFSRLTAFSDSTITTNDNSDNSYSRGNGENEIYLDSTHSTAQCWINYSTSTCTVSEADIRFGNQSWTTGSASQHLPYASGRSILGTAVHEGGHCLGMAHENTVYNMMGSDFSHVTRNNLTTYFGPGEDLSDGLIDLHGKRSGGSNTYRDVGATVMRYDSVSGAYSTHKFGVLLDTGGTVLPVVGSFEGQDVFQITAGKTVRMELTFENNGELNTETPSIGYYLSVNALISSADPLLRTDNNFSLGRATPLETTQSVTIPSDTVPGNYFLGAFVDHEDLISEVTNLNNVAYYPVNIVAPLPDLTVPFASVDDSTLLPGEAFSALAVVRNEGDAASEISVLRYVRSSDSYISLSDDWIRTEWIPSLAAGALKASNVPVVAPGTQGTWWIGACISVVSGEVNTSNQCSTGTQITVAAQSPVVSTGAVTAITTTQATLSATVNANGGATALHFDWGRDYLFDSTLTYGSTITGLSDTSVNITVPGLICGATYQVRARAVNSAGTSLGNVQEFTVTSCPGCE
jgi:hypothetical protein